MTTYQHTEQILIIFSIPTINNSTKQTHSKINYNNSKLNHNVLVQTLHKNQINLKSTNYKKHKHNNNIIDHYHHIKMLTLLILDHLLISIKIYKIFIINNLKFSTIKSNLIHSIKHLIKHSLSTTNQNNIKINSINKSKMVSDWPTKSIPL